MLSYRSFCEGAGDVLNKHGESGIDIMHRYVDGWRSKGPQLPKSQVMSKIEEPLAAGVSDQFYGGLGKYDSATGQMVPNTQRGIDTITRGEVFAPPKEVPKQYGWGASKALYNLGTTRVGKFFADLRTGGDRVIGKTMSDETGGVLNMGDGKVQLDRTKLPGLVMSRAKSWAAAHKNELMMGLGIGVAGLGALAFSGNRNKQQPTPLSQTQPAPFAGREGNVFQNYYQA